jgi:hypothetical protein
VPNLRIVLSCRGTRGNKAFPDLKAPFARDARLEMDWSRATQKLASPLYRADSDIATCLRWEVSSSCEVVSCS